MANVTPKTSWASAVPLRDAWRAYADLHREGFMLLKRYEVLLRGAIDGEPSDRPPHVFQEFEPKYQGQRGNLSEYRLKCLHIKLLDHLAEGELVAYAKQVEPLLENEPCELPAGLFADRVGVLDIGWTVNQVATASQRFGDVRVVQPTRPARRGKPQMHLDLKEAAQIAMMNDPSFLTLPPKEAHHRTLDILRSDSKFKNSRAKAAERKTFYPVFAALRKAAGLSP